MTLGQEFVVLQNDILWEKPSADPKPVSPIASAKRSKAYLEPCRDEKIHCLMGKRMLLYGYRIHADSLN